MDLKGISEKAVEGKEALEATRRKKTEAERENQKIGEIVRRVHEKEAPFVSFARGLMSLTQARARRFSDPWERRTPVEPSTSPLIKVGNEGKNKHYFVAARQNYVPSDYDADANPRGQEFVGYSFVASIGMKMTEREYYAIPYDERDKLRYLGNTLSGETMYGSVISEERFGSPSPNFTTAKQAQSYEGRVDEALTAAAETMELVRQSLANERLNPRNGLQVPEALL